MDRPTDFYMLYRVSEAVRSNAAIGKIIQDSLDSIIDKKVFCRNVFNSDIVNNNYD